MIKNRVIYLLLLIYGILFVILYDEYISFVSFIILLSVPIVMVLISLFASKKLQYFLEVEQTTVRMGEIVEVKVIVQNKGIFPVTYGKLYFTCKNLFAKKNALKSSIKFSLNAKEKKEITISFLGRHCGMAIFTIEKIKIYDYLKIWNWKKKMDKKVSVSVMPNIQEQEEMLEVDIYQNDNNQIEEISENYSLHKPGDDVGQIFDIRSYRPGDRAQRIHWKLSSKKQELMVKEFSQPLGGQFEIWFDFYCPIEKDRFHVMDKLFTKLCYIIETLIEQGREYKILWYDIDKKEQVEFIVGEQLEEVFDLLFCTPCYAESNLLFDEYKKRDGVQGQGYYIGVGIWEDSFVNGGQ